MSKLYFQISTFQPKILRSSPFKFAVLTCHSGLTLVLAFFSCIKFVGVFCWPDGKKEVNSLTLLLILNYLPTALNENCIYRYAVDRISISIKLQISCTFTPCHCINLYSVLLNKYDITNTNLKMLKRQLIQQVLGLSTIFIAYITVVQSNMDYF